MKREWALLAIIPFIVLVHGLPHLPGDAPTGPADTYVELGSRTIDGLTGDDYPYPVHVDEHIHIAWMSELDRSGHADIGDPYTGEPSSGDLFTVAGMRSERGFTVAGTQIHQVTGVDFPALARFLPAIWAGCLALGMWSMLRPAPGAAVAAAMVAILPSSARFLGIGFLVPSSFGLIWVIATLTLALRGKGPGRFFGLILLITGAHFIHLVIGVLSLVVGIGGTLARSENWRTRASLLLAVVFPLVWIIPSAYADAVLAISSEHTLPFDSQFLATPTWAIYGLAVAGGILAHLRPNPRNAPHRVLTWLAIGLATSLAWSAANDHRSDATYSRIVFAFFLSVAGPASYAIGRGFEAITTKWPKPWVVRGTPFVAAAVVALLLANPVASIQTTGMYRIHDDESWAAIHALEADGAGPEHRFLGPPWQAPLVNAATGARPHAWLYPGSAPVNDADYGAYVRGELTAEWYQTMGIDYVLGRSPPAAPHDTIAPNVHRIR